MQSQEALPPTRGANKADTGRPHRRCRITLSCDPCRSRKLKCNRETPCQNCTARNEEAACKFRGPKNGSTSVSLAPRHNGDAMRRRIENLEDLVKRLVAERQQVPSLSGIGVYTPDESPKTDPGTTGRTVSTDSQVSDTYYVGQGAGKTLVDGTHSVFTNTGGNDWHVVLQEINELKSTWDTEHGDHHDDSLQPPLSHTVDGSSLLFNQARPIERMEILSTLPPKSEVDQLISQFFDRKTFPINVPPILHEPTFRREYDEHWRDPSKTDFIWLGLLFSILDITMLAYHQHGEPPRYEGISESLFHLYRMRTAQCLVSGDIAKCLSYTVETLRFNATAELNRKDDNSRGLWIMTGVVLRAAINMGYHRDPSQIPGISVLQAEYRRRTWLSVVSMDDMASFLSGFPQTSSAISSDTMEPGNLHDWELCEDTVALPPVRPLTEPTSTTYMLVKGRLFRALARVVDINSSPSPISYETVVEVDHAVHDAYEQFPPYMKVAPAEDSSNPVEKAKPSFPDLSLAAMYHKGILLLHRNSMARSRTDDRFQFSRDRCISSALALMALQQNLEPSFYKLSQLQQILILAAMILFLELELRRKDPDVEARPESGVILHALEQSCAHLAEAMGTCDEIWNIHQFLVGMLSAFHERSNWTESPEAALPEVAFEFTGFDPQINALATGVSFEDDSSPFRIDWGTWDAFMEEATYKPGPAY